MELEHPGNIFDGTLTEVRGKGTRLNTKGRSYSHPYILLHCLDEVTNHTMLQDESSHAASRGYIMCSALSFNRVMLHL